MQIKNTNCSKDAFNYSSEYCPWSLDYFLRRRFAARYFFTAYETFNFLRLQGRRLFVSFGMFKAFVMWLSNKVSASTMLAWFLSGSFLIYSIKMPRRNRSSRHFVRSTDDCFLLVDSSSFSATSLQDRFQHSSKSIGFEWRPSGRFVGDSTSTSASCESIGVFSMLSPKRLFAPSVLEWVPLCT